MLEQYILPALGQLAVAEISSADVTQIVVDLKQKPYRANRVRALLSKMFSLAVSWRWTDRNPVSGTHRFQETPRERWLAEDELVRLWVVLQEHPDRRSAQAIQLLALTGARRSEVLEAEWSQFDLLRGYWTKPAHFTKQNKMHRVSLSAPALQILRERRETVDRDNTFVFPGNRPGKPRAISRSSGSRSVTRRRLKAVASTTCATPMHRTSSPAANH